MIAEYIAKVEDKINQIRWLIKNESIEAEIISSSKKTYRFHYMDKKNNLIQRWDTAPHHKEIKTHPFHTHTPKTVFESKPLNLLQVLDIISDSIRKSL